MIRYPLLILLAACVTACAAGNKPKLPYPAFEQTDDLPDMYMATLPGVVAKPLAGDMRLRTSSNRVDLPADWSGTTGGAPGMATEIFVLEGELSLSDFVLESGGYAYLPPGSLGFRMHTTDGARILHFHDVVASNAVIRTPLLLDSELVDWAEIAPGQYRKELRHDPGSGATTWLWRIEPGAVQQWLASSAVREGYMVAGSYQHSECFGGEAHTWQYLPGGYFQRPPDTYSGGPLAIASSETIWFLREQGSGNTSVSDVCAAPAPTE